MSGPQHFTRWIARGLLARDVFQRAAALLGKAGVPVVPLKGIVLASVAPEVTRDRPLLDVDVLVPASLARRALEALSAGGFHEVARSVAAVTLKEAGHDVSLDLHTRLFAPWLFRMEGASVLRRGRVGDIFGVEAVLPSGLDVYAHLVGHFAKGRHTRAEVWRVRDFGIVANAYDLDARDCAVHLTLLGLARAARYALVEVIEGGGDTFAASVLAHLERDPLGSRLADLARSLGRTPNPLSPLAPYVLAETLPRAAAAAGLHLQRASLRRLRGERP